MVNMRNFLNVFELQIFYLYINIFNDYVNRVIVIYVLRIYNERV